MWSHYSAREAAQLIGLPESAVRSLARAGVIGAPGEVPLRLGFRDLASLRRVKALVDAGVPLSRASREVIALLRGAQEAAAQLDLFARPAAPSMAEVHAMPVRREPPSLQPVVSHTADEWFERALGAEESDVEAAIDAYRRCLRLRPDSTEAWINLGRLHAENGDADLAVESFERARSRSTPTTPPRCTTSASSPRTPAARRTRSATTRAPSSSIPSSPRPTTTSRRSSISAARPSRRSATSTSTGS